MTDPSDRELAVFSAVRRLSAPDRPAYLDEACVGDDALRQRVEELLEASDEAGTFLEGPAPGAEPFTSGLERILPGAARSAAIFQGNESVNLPDSYPRLQILLLEQGGVALA